MPRRAWLGTAADSPASARTWTSSKARATPRSCYPITVGRASRSWTRFEPSCGVGRRQRPLDLHTHMRASSLLGLSTVTASLAVIAAWASVQQSSVSLFQGETDVGQVTKRGSVTYDAGRDHYTVAGSGANMWFDRDDFHFVWKRLAGNFILTA